MLIQYCRENTLAIHKHLEVRRFLLELRNIKVNINQLTMLQIDFIIPSFMLYDLPANIKKYKCTVRVIFDTNYNLKMQINDVNRSHNLCTG